MQILILQRFGTAEEDAYRRDLTINRYLSIHFHFDCILYVFFVWYLYNVSLLNFFSYFDFLLNSLFYNINTSSVEDFTGRGTTSLCLLVATKM